MIKVETALKGVTKLFLDTAPVIYFVEANPNYLQVVESIFDKIENGLASIAILNELWTQMSLKSSPGKELHA
jgi:hypothetical protein